MLAGVSRLGLSGQRSALNISISLAYSTQQTARIITAIPRQLSTQSSSQPSICQRKVRSVSTRPAPFSSVQFSYRNTHSVERRHVSTARQAAQTPSSVLDWNTFFTLRTSRRRFSLASSIVSSAAVTTGAFFFLSTQPELADEITKLIPTDPVISMGLLTFAATFFGWLIGPVFGNTAWKLLNRSKIVEFTAKERAFFDRIKKHRVNPMGASTNNPVPDFYGEKIGSVQGYRRWLKDQRAFNRKREGQYPGGI